MSTYDVERFLKVGGVHGPTFGPEGDRVAFLAETTGTRQAWVVDGPRRWPSQLTFFDDRVTFVSWSPTTDVLAVGSDRGGDQRTGLFLVDEDRRVGGVTDDPEASHRWGGWSNGGRRFAYAADGRFRGSFDVYVRSVDADGAECVLETDGWFDVLGWGPDDERLLLRETHSSLDHELHVTDLDGASRRLTGTSDSARFESVNWGPSGESVWCVTDAGADTRYVATIDLGDGTLEPVRFDGGPNFDEWNAEGLNVDDETGRVVSGYNVDGYTAVLDGQVTEPGTISVRGRPSLPDGVAGEVSFTPDGRRFAITVTTRSRPPDVYVVAPEPDSVERWTCASTAGMPRSAFVEPSVVRYRSVDDLEVPALYSVPETDGATTLPAIVDVHGGPEEQRRPSFSPVRQFFIESGFVVLEPNVRGSTGYGAEYAGLDDCRNRLDAVADVEAAHRWLCERPDVDPDRVAVFGESYGGFAALLALARNEADWAAGVAHCPITNLVTFLDSTSDWRRPIREAEYGSLEADRDFLEEISPTTVADRIDAPLMLVHGANDPRVPVRETRRIAEAVDGAGVPVERMILEDEGHGVTGVENRVRVYEAMVSFLREAL